MRSARRGTRYAVFGFILVAGVVLGGMTWATMATLDLAELKNDYKVSTALSAMDGYLGPILTTEAQRPPTEYTAVYRPTLRTREGHLLDPSEYEVFGKASLLALEEPRYEWIELYFQVDHRGFWSSPQILDPGIALADSPYTNPVVAQRLSNTFQQVQTALTHARLDTFAGRVWTCACPLRGQPGHENCDCLCAMRLAQRDSRGRHQTVLVNEWQRRQRSQAASQLNSLPSALCLTDESDSERISFEASRVPMEAVWLDSGDGEELKLAFLRMWVLGTEVVHQGFVADWSRLKRELLAQIDSLFPDADLEPILGDLEPDPETQATTINPIRARLVVPSLAGGPRAAAWRSVRGILLSTWAAAVAILVAAGWGVRNLVALTQRRMQFAYAVTHELRTPLTTFRLYSDMLSAGLVPDEAKQEYLDTLNRESLRLSNLVQGILEYARLENQKLRLDPTETDVSSLADLVREGLEERCRENGIEARTKNEIAGDTPLKTDLDLVSRIVGVLVSNACRHARSAEHPTVAMHLGGQNGQVHLDVIDSGPGIDRGDARTIFRPFRRGRGADAAARGGIGLGLALARSWAKLLGGRLDLVASHHGEYGGAHFRLTIPNRLPPH